jgi:hypothetical protein
VRCVFPLDVGMGRMAVGWLPNATRIALAPYRQGHLRQISCQTLSRCWTGSDHVQWRRVTVGEKRQKQPTGSSGVGKPSGTFCRNYGADSLYL